MSIVKPTAELFREEMELLAASYRVADFKNNPNGYHVSPTVNEHTTEDAFLAGARAALESDLVKQMAEALRCNAVNPSRADIMEQSDKALAAATAAKGEG